MTEALRTCPRRVAPKFRRLPPPPPPGYSLPSMQTLQCTGETWTKSPSGKGAAKKEFVALVAKGKMTWEQLAKGGGGAAKKRSLAKKKAA